MSKVDYLIEKYLGSDDCCPQEKEMFLEELAEEILDIAEEYDLTEEDMSILLTKDEYTLYEGIASASSKGTLAGAILGLLSPMPGGVFAGAALGGGAGALLGIKGKLNKRRAIKRVKKLEAELAKCEDEKCKKKITKKLTRFKKILEKMKKKGK